MAVRRSGRKGAPTKLATLCVEHERLIASQRRQIAALEQERSQLQHGFEVLTRALRRRGCCDHGTNGETPA